MATLLQLRKIALRVLPDLAPEFALSQQRLFLARVMSIGNLEEAHVVVDHFGTPAIRAVLSNPPARIFDRETWNYWHAFLGMEPVAMPRSFFTVNARLNDHPATAREITAQLLGDFSDQQRPSAHPAFYAEAN